MFTFRMQLVSNVCLLAEFKREKDLKILCNRFCCQLLVDLSTSHCQQQRISISFASWILEPDSRPPESRGDRTTERSDSIGAVHASQPQLPVRSSLKSCAGIEFCAKLLKQISITR